MRTRHGSKERYEVGIHTRHGSRGRYPEGYHHQEKKKRNAQMTASDTENEEEEEEEEETYESGQSDTPSEEETCVRMVEDEEYSTEEPEPPKRILSKPPKRQTPKIKSASKKKEPREEEKRLVKVKEKDAKKAKEKEKERRMEMEKKKIEEDIESVGRVVFECERRCQKTCNLRDQFQNLCLDSQRASQPQLKATPPVNFYLEQPPPPYASPSEPPTEPTEHPHSPPAFTPMQLDLSNSPFMSHGIAPSQPFHELVQGWQGWGEPPHPKGGHGDQAGEWENDWDEEWDGDQDDENIQENEWTGENGENDVDHEAIEQEKDWYVEVDCKLNYLNEKFQGFLGWSQEVDSKLLQQDRALEYLDAKIQRLKRKQKEPVRHVHHQQPASEDESEAEEPMEFVIEGSKVKFSPSPEARKITNRYFDASQSQMVLWSDSQGVTATPRDSNVRQASHQQPARKEGKQVKPSQSRRSGTSQKNAYVRPVMQQGNSQAMVAGGMGVYVPVALQVLQQNLTLPRFSGVENTYQSFVRDWEKYAAYAFLGAPPGPMQEIWKRDLLIQCLQGTLKEKYLAQVEAQPKTTYEDVWKELERSYQIDNPHYWRDKWIRVQLTKYGENVSLKEWLLYRAAHEAAKRQVSDYTTMEEVDMVLKQLPAGWRKKVIQQEAKENNNQYRVKLSGMPPNTTKAKVSKILESGRIKPSQIIEEKGCWLVDFQKEDDMKRLTSCSEFSVDNYQVQVVQVRRRWTASEIFDYMTKQLRVESETKVIQDSMDKRGGERRFERWNSQPSRWNTYHQREIQQHGQQQAFRSKCYVCERQGRPADHLWLTCPEAKKAREARMRGEYSHMKGGRGKGKGTSGIQSTSSYAMQQNSQSTTSAVKGKGKGNYWNSSWTSKGKGSKGGKGFKGKGKGRGKSYASYQTSGGWTGGRGKGQAHYRPSSQVTSSLPSTMMPGKGKGKGVKGSTNWTRQVVLSSDQVKQAQPTICRVQRWNEKQLYMEVEVKTRSGKKKLARVLIDTGAEANLVGSDLFDEEDFEPAMKPLQLRTVSGEQLQGGKQVIRLQLAFCARPVGASQVHQEVISGTFYQASIGWDAIISYPLLAKWKLGVLPHRACLLMEKPKGFFLLYGTKCRADHSIQAAEVCSVKPDASMLDNHSIIPSHVVSEVVAALCDGERPQVDAFASPSNARFPRYWTKAIDAFQQDWSKDFLWINPPFGRMDAVVRKVISEGAKALIIAPQQRSSSWWNPLMSVSQGEKLVCTKWIHGVQTRIMAYFVDGKLRKPAVHYVREIMARQLQVDPADRPKHDCLTMESVNEILLHLDDEPLQVRSVVQTQSVQQPKEIQQAMEHYKKAILKEFGHDVLSGKMFSEPPIRGAVGLATIDLKEGAEPKRQRAFQMNHERQEALNKILKEYQDLGWIEPSYSEWGSPAFVVPKKQPGEWRMVVDYRRLNEMTRHDSYNLPLISEVLQKQAKKTVFTVLDMKRGFHQLPLAPESRPLTAMSVPSGLWQWKVLPMGVRNGNALFQRMMDDVLRDEASADVFVDDVIISSGGATPMEAVKNHYDDLTRVLNIFRKNKLVCDMEKAQLFVSHVEYCGHIVGGGSRRPAPGKLTALEKWRLPETVTELRSYLGFCNWYGDYIPMYAEIAAPLHAMLQLKRSEGKKGSTAKLKWTEEAIAAFHQLKEVLLKRLELELVDPDRPFI